MRNLSGHCNPAESSLLIVLLPIRKIMWGEITRKRGQKFWFSLNFQNEVINEHWWQISCFLLKVPNFPFFFCTILPHHLTKKEASNFVNKGLTPWI